MVSTKWYYTHSKGNVYPGRGNTIVPVRVIEGDFSGTLAERSDVLVRGHVRHANITTTGQVAVLGNVEESEIHGADIRVEGHVVRSQLLTMPAGYHAPLRGELGFLRGLGDIPGAFVGGVRRKADELRVVDPDFKAVMIDLASHALSAHLNEVLDEAARVALIGDVQARSLFDTTVWAGRDILVLENIVGSSLFCGGMVETPICVQSEILAAAEIRLGILTPGSTVRCRLVEAGEVQAGSAFEFGGDRWEVGADLFGVTVGVTDRGMLRLHHS